MQKKLSCDSAEKSDSAILLYKEFISLNTDLQSLGLFKIRINHPSSKSLPFD